VCHVLHSNILKASPGRDHTGQLGRLQTLLIALPTLFESNPSLLGFLLSPFATVSIFTSAFKNI
jgi:hypothetical protein